MKIHVITVLWAVCLLSLKTFEVDALRYSPKPDSTITACKLQIKSTGKYSTFVSETDPMCHLKITADPGYSVSVSVIHLRNACRNNISKMFMTETIKGASSDEAGKEVKIFPKCSGSYEFMGSDTNNVQLNYSPRQAYLIEVRFIRRTLGCNESVGYDQVGADLTLKHYGGGTCFLILPGRAYVTVKSYQLSEPNCESSFKLYAGNTAYKFNLVIGQYCTETAPTLPKKHAILCNKGLLVFQSNATEANPDSVVFNVDLSDPGRRLFLGSAKCYDYDD
ncbi:hypothetical protein L596_003657 [Steinernema carpocapsae]|uniref:CUB domain-containing protein n=1 Tax=Steinernema carpocapsae TaxID=34508 RepID=A0A4U8UT51_STECR|nr:hypothetical protein L596_003657 [Steinernema carpocapsae]